MRVIRVDGATGQATAVLTETSPTFVDYSQKEYLRWLNEDGSSAECLWASERSGHNHVYLYDLGHGDRCEGKQITRGGLVRSVEHVDTETRRLWFQGCGSPGVDPYYMYHTQIGCYTLSHSLVPRPES